MTVLKVLRSAKTFEKKSKKVLGLSRRDDIMAFISTFWLWIEGKARRQTPHSLVLLPLPVGPWVFEKTPRGEHLLIYAKSAFEIKRSQQLGEARRQFKYGQLTNQIVLYDRPTDQIVPFVGEQDMSKEQGLAAGVLSPLLPPLPPPPSSNFCRNACNAGYEYTGECQSCSIRCGTCTCISGNHQCSIF